MSTSKQCPSEDNSISKVSAASKSCDVVDNSSFLKTMNSVDRSVENNKGDGLNDPEMIDKSLMEPKIGMVFYSEDQAYNFYNSYAKRKGFSVRKDHLSRRKDGSIRYRHYLCSNEGTRQEHRTHVAKKARSIERTNCLARIEFKVSNDNVWVVNKFIDEHNHPLASPHNSHMLRSHRKKLPVQHGGGTNSDDFGAKPIQLHKSQLQEAQCTEVAGFTLKDQVNFLNTRRMRDFENGDAQFLLDFLKAKQSDDPSFFYAIQLDEMERLTNCFWADAQSIIDYAYFGDAVTFDTTYHISMNDIPFAPFIGTNHHKQIVILGAALLLDETVESYVWLFRSFLAAMSGRQPKTIFTDQCAAISKAISMVLPETCHRLCLWHILYFARVHLPNACSHGPNLHEFENFIYDIQSEDDFDKEWDRLVSLYGLGSSSWLKLLHADREKWALAYLRNSFCSIMTAKQWQGKMDNLFKIYFHRKLPVTKFILQYLKALVQLRDNEILEDYESALTKPVLLVDVPMLIEAADSYTRVMYLDFEQEYRGQLACLCEPIGTDGTVYTFRVCVAQKLSNGLVDFNPSDATVRCSCKKFESMGILCMHALKVLNNNNILHLPSQYLLKRWTKYAKDGATSNGYQSMDDSGGTRSLTLLYNHVCRKAITVAVKSTVSKDALDILEQGLDKFIKEMENVLLNAPSTRQI
ncbi:protein FAR1-RELATED SEQUENCE 5-like [Typha angustifolia]|uniref:protein FAR1-RELATED SEQUENCE 5-like n=1 Tax=Typha angustifolia TaxID=59011 RepID=UPI003C2E9CD1